MDLIEVNPSLDLVGAAETIRAGCSLVRCALGDTLLQRLYVQGRDERYQRVRDEN